MQIENMLYAHQDLLEEFTRFLPNITRPILIPIVAALQDHLLETCIRYSHKEIVVNVCYHVL